MAGVLALTVAIFHDHPVVAAVGNVLQSLKAILNGLTFTQPILMQLVRKAVCVIRHVRILLIREELVLTFFPLACSTVLRMYLPVNLLDFLV